MDSIYPQLVNLIPPAVLLGVVAYLVRFFGRAITDQRPFADDRNWDIEISGIYFFLSFILFSGILGVLGALRFGTLYTDHWARFVIIGICITWLWLLGGLYAKKVYGIKFLWLQSFFIGDPDKEGKAEKLGESILKISRYIPLWIFSVIFIYILTLEYQSNSIGWMLFNGVEIFIGFIFMALIYSLLPLRLPQVDIFFNDGTAMQNVTLLKMNSDNIRIKDGDQVVVINRDQVKKVEFFPPADLDPIKK